MPELSKSDAIYKAYLVPIRTVILVDDGFPRYDHLEAAGIQAIDDVKEEPARPPEPVAAATTPEATAGQPPEPGVEAVIGVKPSGEAEAVGTASTTKVEQPGKEYVRARALWSACRKLGYLCDIDDGAELETSIPEHITKSDLVVLDYHLQKEDPALALKLLRHLAISEHSSLVVVYTKDKELDEVRRKVAVHVRGSRGPESFLNPDELIRWQDLNEWTPSPSQPTLDAFLRSDQAWEADTDLRRELEDLGVPEVERARMIEAAIESFISEKYRPARIEGSIPPVVQASGPDSPRLWIQSGNLFVAFLRKTDENILQGDEVFSALREALENWDPPYLPMMLAYARGVVARGGFQSEAHALSDPLLQAGWLYHAVSGDDFERADRLRELFERLLSRHSEALLEDIAEFGQSCFPKSEGAASTKLAWAKSEVPGCIGSVDWHVLHRLNVFLATQSPGNYVGTGTIFVPKTQEAGAADAWICVTPACDLVPRTPREDTWEHRLHPIRPMLAFGGTLIESGPKPLKEAEYFKYVYLTTDEGHRAIQLVPQHGNGVSRSREFAYTSQTLDCEAKEVTNARDSGKGQG